MSTRSVPARHACAAGAIRGDRQQASPLRAGKLYLKTFSRRQLKGEGLSVARERYTTREQFDKYVVTPRINAPGGDTLLGVSRCNVEILREIKAAVNDGSRIVECRALCVVDYVSPLDFDGHGILCYHDGLELLSEKQRARVRDAIDADVATAFGDIFPIEQAFN